MYLLYWPCKYAITSEQERGENDDRSFNYRYERISKMNKEKGKKNKTAILQLDLKPNLRRHSKRIKFIDVLKQKLHKYV